MNPPVSGFIVLMFYDVDYIQYLILLYDIKYLTTRFWVAQSFKKINQKIGGVGTTFEYVRTDYDILGLGNINMHKPS